MGNDRVETSSKNPSPDSLLLLAELCGVQPSSIDESRIELVSSLQLLCICLKSSKRYTDNELDALNGLEVAAGKARVACDAFSHFLVDQTEEVYSLLGKVESESAAAGNHADMKTVEVSMLARALVAAYRSQAQFERELIQNILSVMSDIYLEDHDGLVDSINTWIEALQSRHLLQSPIWKQALSEIWTDSTEDEFSIFPSHPSNDAIDHSKFYEVTTNVAPSDTIQEVLEDFLLSDVGGSSTALMFVVGASGSGKTYLCDGIERRISEENHGGRHIQVIRPELPLDLLGTSVGETEDSLISIISAACDGGKAVLILDNMEHVVGESYNGPSMSTGGAVSVLTAQETHILARSRSILFSLLGSLKNGGLASHGLLVVATASTPMHALFQYVDYTFFLDRPDERQRRRLIEENFGFDGGRRSSEAETSMQSLVRNTIGRSSAEIAQYCQRAVSSHCFDHELVSDDAATTRVGGSYPEKLRAMQEHLGIIEPESLRYGLSDCVDMTVLTARELTRAATLEFPLFGHDAESARKSIESLIVSPLCFSTALDQILCGGLQREGKSVCGGVLVTGDPGCGKSELAYYCARKAASLLPSVTLIDVVCTSLIHKEVGGSERALQRLFESARSTIPCILLMDGIENIGATRGNDSTTEGTMDRLLSTLLTELDGVDSTASSSKGNCGNKGKVAIIGITKNGDWIDPALRRPGRLDKVIRLARPDKEARVEIAKRELSSVNWKIEDGDDMISAIADQTYGLSGADVVACCRQKRMDRLLQEVYRAAPA